MIVRDGLNVHSDPHKAQLHFPCGQPRTSTAVHIDTFAGGEDFTQPVQLIFVHQRVTFVQKLLVGVQNLSGSAVCDGFLIQFIEPFFVVEEKFPISFVAAFLCEPGQGWFGYIEERGYIFLLKINPLLVMQKEIGDGLFCR